ncbi:hypothetical protein [Hymenobacter negativus]|uniref:Glycosyltransferase RgtA/B/C/D-like domain-containing protein n=1 Tax=Hymenobacter negativus TaxID=2795026 RepID=A0ABS0Q5V4_9BACT|nr:MULTISPECIES: hypothetical protein [Bacteria]MBH8557634.1 hypothetical protein [Hymenobacter negativus]MBH8567836.1 hypothetical protein [Hymenobacter negativus]MBR7207572.1 hypothetical protein [Microvirga sp. STS02]
MHASGEQGRVAGTASRWLGPMVQVVVGLLALAVLAVMVWALPRGFDITDEGFYLLNFRYPAEYEASFSTFHLIVARMLGLANASVFTTRAVGLGAAVFGAVVFGLSLAAWLRATTTTGARRWASQPGLAVCFVLLGSLLVFSIFPRAISYNGITSLSLLLSAAAVLSALRRGPLAATWQLLGIGFVLGIDVFVKASSAALLFGGAVVVLAWYWRSFGWQVLLRTAVLLGLGLALGLGLYFVVVEPLGLWHRNFVQEMTALQSQGRYGMADLLPKYISSAFRTLLFLVFPLGPVVAVLVGLAWWWPRRVPAAWHRLAVLAIGGGMGTFLLMEALRRRWYSNAISNGLETLPLLLALVVITALVMAALAVQPKSRETPATSGPAALAQQWPVGLWLLSLPLLAAAGTINDLRLNLLVDMAPWFGLLLILVSQVRLALLPAWVPAAMLLVPASYAAEQTIWGVLWTPYNLAATMAAQTEPLHAAGVTGPLQVDPATSAFITQLEKLLAAGGFRPGDPLLAFYDLPGVVYLCGGVSPGAAWYFPGRDARNCHALDITAQPLRKACILLNQPMGNELKACLHKHGLAFPENYRLVGTVLSSYQSEHRQIQVYAPQDASSRPN